MKTAAILGHGRMGKEHERAYQECGVKVLNKYTKEDEGFMELPMSDYVSVCTHDDTHAYYILDALSAGSKVIAEKPLCLTEDDLKRIHAVSNEWNLACNLPLVHLDWPMPDYADPKHISAEYIWGRADRIKEWRSKCPGYSFVLGAGVHLTSMLLNMGGAIHAVTATGKRTSPDIDCETEVWAIGEYAGGGTFAMHINCGTVEQHRHRFVIDGEDIGHRDTDKGAEIRRFIEKGYGHHGHIFAAHSVCFAIERALKSGKRETVEYLP